MPKLTAETLQKLIDPIVGWKSFPKGPIRGIAVDSRKVQPGDLFVALPGEITDGHNFIQDAAKKGASGVLVERVKGLSLPENVGIGLVDEGILFLQKLAYAVISKVSPTVLAITGSLGKTTTKEYTKAILGACGSVAATEENNNSQIGMAMSIINANLKAKKAPRWFVAEMGMTEKGNISKLVSVCPPDVALVTRIAPVHSQNFSALEELAKAKSEIFQSPRCKTSIVNLDSPYAPLLVKKAKGKVVTVSCKEKATYFLNIEEQKLVLEHEGKQFQFKKPQLPAIHMYENLLHAMALALEGGADVETFHDAIQTLPSVSGRLEFIEHNGILFINDSYNAAQLSMLSALSVLEGIQGRRRIAILGQMRELGAFSKRCHEKVGRAARTASDLLFCLGEECGPLVEAFRVSQKPCTWAKSLDELKELLSKELVRGDAVLLKGSHSNKLWEIVDHFRGNSYHVSTH